MAVIEEVYPTNKSNYKINQSEAFADVIGYEECIEWYHPGDGLMVFLNVSNHMMAVYQRYGVLLCLMRRFCIYEMVDDSLGVNEEIRSILQREAIDYGFPITPPRSMTWRDVMDSIEGMPDEVLDMDAQIWLAPECGTEVWTVDKDMFPCITGLRPYDGALPAGKDNPLSFEIEGCC
jgi:hypothetical protein